MPSTITQIPILYSKQLTFGKLELRCDGIIKYSLVDNYEIQKQDVLQISAETKKIANGKRIPLLIVTGAYTSISSEAFEALDSKESLEYSLAEAFVIKSTPQRLLADFYLRIKKPYVPTAYFANEEKALEWLKKFSNENELITSSQDFI